MADGDDVTDKAPAERTVRKRDSAGTRARILNVATREFANKGYEGAKTDDIADRARINKRMIYHYFSSKELLYLAVLEAAYERARSAEQKLELDQLAPVEALTRFVEFTFDSFVRDRTFIIARGHADGTIRAGLDARQLWITIIGICYFFFSNIYTLSVIFDADMEDPASIAARRTHVVDFVLRGVRA
ncbi:MAG: tetR [Xanthobacteraceae bacterium]|nr:MAG: tetR [Xanthobacteraceae bacterium]